VWPDVLGVVHVSVPYANADENNHSPNENLSLERFYDGIHVSAEVFWALSQAGRWSEVGSRSAPPV
jgi:acetylornithine deacetylase/succinyl-diaminopimelate desuccinylase-like protein